MHGNDGAAPDSTTAIQATKPEVVNRRVQECIGDEDFEEHCVGLNTALEISALSAPPGLDTATAEAALPVVAEPAAPAVVTNMVPSAPCAAPSVQSALAANIIDGIAAAPVRTASPEALAAASGTVWGTNFENLESITERWERALASVASSSEWAQRSLEKGGICSTLRAVDYHCRRRNQDPQSSEHHKPVGPLDTDMAALWNASMLKATKSGLDLFPFWVVCDGQEPEDSLRLVTEKNFSYWYEVLPDKAPITVCELQVPEQLARLSQPLCLSPSLGTLYLPKPGLNFGEYHVKGKYLRERMRGVCASLPGGDAYEQVKQAIQLEQEKGLQDQAAYQASYHSRQADRRKKKNPFATTSCGDFGKLQGHTWTASRSLATVFFGDELVWGVRANDGKWEHPVANECGRDDVPFPSSGAGPMWSAPVEGKRGDESAQRGRRYKCWCCRWMRFVDETKAAGNTIYAVTSNVFEPSWVLTYDAASSELPSEEFRNGKPPGWGEGTLCYNGWLTPVSRQAVPHPRTNKPLGEGCRWERRVLDSKPYPVYCCFFP